MNEVIARRVHKRNEAAQELNISIRKLDQLIAEKAISTVRIGKSRLITEEALQRFLKKAEKETR